MRELDKKLVRGLDCLENAFDRIEHSQTAAKVEALDAIDPQAARTQAGLNGLDAGILESHTVIEASLTTSDDRRREEDVVSPADPPITD